MKWRWVELPMMVGLMKWSVMNVSITLNIIRITADIMLPCMIRIAADNVTASTIPNGIMASIAVKRPNRIG